MEEENIKTKIKSLELEEWNLYVEMQGFNPTQMQKVEKIIRDIEELKMHLLLLSAINLIKV